jgi:pyruvate formate lyase activating enzyme
MNAPLIPLSSGGEVGLKFVKERILANIDFLDAIGISGGEPGIQPEPIIALCSWAKKKRIKTFLNSNGSNPKLIRKLLDKHLLDHIAIDVKAPLSSEAYSKVIGLNESIDRILSDIRQSLELCLKASLSVEVRTTIVPTLIDDERSIREIARVVKGYGIYVLQQYFSFEEVLDERLRKVKPPDRATLVRLAGFSLEEGAREVYIRTREYGMERIK